ncbi:hypothetical protein NLI96_g627 [Meripilus lineatus]|uniref:Uncharacterized protein n=1 Tax=Meripilus lineatus TaxID=2056292 RepID=A0AAD5VDX0_9APHY|nr:hypothetical protein NLI96_g627 [Physisporinus lineatus]
MLSLDLQVTRPSILRTRNARLYRLSEHRESDEMTPEPWILYSPADSFNVHRGTTRLPVEVILIILNHLVSTTYHQALPFVFETPFRIRLQDTDVAKLVYRQLSLYNVALVCRLWNSFGTQYLYSHPCLSTPAHVHLLRRTLTNGPRFCRFIKHIFAVDFVSSVYVDEASKSLAFNFFRRREDPIKRRKSDILSILDSCGNLSLESMTLINHDEEPSTISQGALFLEALSMGARLRRLVLDGTTIQQRLTKLTLPSLEVLCLRCFTFENVLPGLPVLPRLHTLQLAKVYSWIDFRLVIEHERLPMLRSLEMYQCAFHGLVPPLRSLSFLPDLEDLRLVGSNELDTFQYLIKFCGLPSIRHIAIGEPNTNPTTLDFSSWIFPDTLECLTVFAVVAGRPPLSELLHCLELNRSRNNLRTLKRVNILGVVPARGDLLFIGEVQWICKSNGIRLHLSDIVLNEWVTGRLSMNGLTTKAYPRSYL